MPRSLCALKVCREYRQHGGPVLAGRSYVVGERGPEYFVPSTAGAVLPNGVRPGGRGGVTINGPLMGEVHVHNEADENRLAETILARIAQLEESITGAAPMGLPGVPVR